MKDKLLKVALFGIKKLWAFIAWVFTGFGLLSAFNGKNYKLDEIVLYRVPRAFFLWFLILTGFIISAVVRHSPVHAVEMGWLYLFIVMYTLLAILYDISPLMLLLISLVVGFVCLLSSRLEQHHHLLILTFVVRYLKSLKPSLSPGWVSAFSWFLVIPWITSLVHAFGWGRVTISPNGVEEWHLGQGSEITDRVGLKFRSRYYDLLESFLGGGAGTLEALNNDHSVVKRYENVLFLYFWWTKLDGILHQRAATIDNAPDDAVEVEDINLKKVVK